MSVIANLLDVLFDRRTEKEAVQQEIEAWVAEFIPDLVSKRDKISEDVKSLEKEVKERAKYVPDPHTLVGDHLQLVHVKRSPKIDETAVLQLLVKYNELAEKYGEDLVSDDDLKIDGGSYWSIRKRGN